MAKSTLTQSRLKSLLNYDPDTGIFTWLVSPSNCSPAGSVAGGPRSDGYWRIGVDGIRYLAHRLAFLYMTGDFPPDQIDHRNLLKGDNSWDNLRPATHGQNNYNRKPRSASGLKGVYLRKDIGRWLAKACIDGKQYHLGVYDTEEEAAAAAAYARFAKENFPEWMRLR